MFINRFMSPANLEWFDIYKLYLTVTDEIFRAVNSVFEKGEIQIYGLSKSMINLITIMNSLLRV